VQGRGGRDARAVVRLDVVGRDLEGLTQLARDAVERCLHLGDRHGQAVEAHAVETLGEIEHRAVALATDARQDLAHRADGTVLVEPRPRKLRRERA
jgi:hypothetical protein